MSRFTLAPQEIRDVARRVLSEKFPTLACLRPQPPKIEWTVADMLTSGGRVLPTKTRITTLEDRILGHPDVIITVNEQVWRRLDELSREAAVASALYALDPVLVPTMDEGPRAALDSANRPILKAVRPDLVLTGYSEIAAWYGPHALVVKAHRAIGETLRQLVLNFLGTPVEGTDPTADLGPSAPSANGDGRPKKGDAVILTGIDLVKDALAAMLSVGHSEEQARRLIDRAMASGRVFAHVSELIDAVYSLPPEKADLDAETEPEADRLGALDAELANGVAMAEALKSDDPEAFLRTLPLEMVDLDPATRAALVRDEVRTYGDLDDFLDGCPVDSEVARHLGIGEDAARTLRTEVARFREGYEAGVKVGAPDEPVEIHRDLEELLEAESDADAAERGLTGGMVETALGPGPAYEPVDDNAPAAEDCCQTCGEVWTDCTCAGSLGDLIETTDAVVESLKARAREPLPPHLSDPKGPALDRDVWLLLSSDRLTWATDSFYANPILKFPDQVDGDLMRRADAAVVRIGGDWADDVKGYIFELARPQDALAAMVKSKRAPAVWQDADLSGGLILPSVAKKLAEAGIRTAGQLDAKVKTLHDQEVLARTHGIPEKDMEDSIVALEAWIACKGHPAPKGDPVKVIAALKKVEAIGRKPRKTPAPTPAPVAESAGEDGLFLVCVGSQRKPSYAVRAPSRLGAIYFVKSREERARVEPDDGTAARLGLPVMEAKPKATSECSHCKGAPKTICPACGKLGPTEHGDPQPKRERPAAKAKPRRKPAGPAEAVAS